MKGTGVRIIRAVTLQRAKYPATMVCLVPIPVTLACVWMTTKGPHKGSSVHLTIITTAVIPSPSRRPDYRNALAVDRGHLSILPIIGYLG